MRTKELFEAIRSNDIKAVAALNAVGVDMNKVDPQGYGETALEVAIENNCSPKLVAILINGGAKINVLDERGHTPLFEAFRQAPELFQILVHEGAVFSMPDLEALKTSPQFVTLCKQAGVKDQILANYCAVIEVFKAEEVKKSIDEENEIDLPEEIIPAAQPKGAGGFSGYEE
jgi:hypothetical protein